MGSYCEQLMVMNTLGITEDLKAFKAHEYVAVGRWCTVCGSGTDKIEWFKCAKTSWVGKWAHKDFYLFRCVKCRTIYGLTLAL